MKKSGNRTYKYSFHEDKNFEAGFTLVETLVSIAILLGVLIPAILFLGRSTMNRSNLDLMTASNLAQEEMEKTIAFGLFRSSEIIVQSDGLSWRIERNIEKADGLIKILVRVFRMNHIDPVVEIKTLRTADD